MNANVSADEQKAGHSNFGEQLLDTHLVFWLAEWAINHGYFCPPLQSEI